MKQGFSTASRCWRWYRQSSSAGCLRRSVVGAEKGQSHRKVRAVKAPHTDKGASRSMIPATRTKKPGRPGENSKKLRARRWGGRELLQSWLLRAWIPYRLRPNGKRRGKGEAMLNGSLLARSL